MDVRGFVDNIVSAAVLDVDFYRRAEESASLNRQVALVVTFASVLAGIGAAVAVEASVPLGAVAGMVTGVIGWLVWSAISLFIGTRFLGGTADFGEMSRVIGYALAPIGIGVVPWLGFVGALWSLAAAAIAIREGLDVSTWRALASTAVGWAAWLLLSVAANALLGTGVDPLWPF